MFLCNFANKVSKSCAMHKFCMLDDFNEIMDCFRVPLRTARRKSVMPPGLINNSDFLDPSDGPDQSPQNSITSINSISSLLKEKFAVKYMF